MNLKILISGFGSIGLKHAKIVKEIFPSCNLAVFSKRNIKNYKKIYDVKDIYPSIYLVTELSRNKL